MPGGAAVGVAGAGCADGVAGTGVVIGVMLIPVTLPVTASFCFLLVVPRALRVASAFAAAAASSVPVRGAGAFRGSRPNRARMSVAVPNIASRFRLRASTTGPTFATVTPNAATATFAFACAVFTALIASIRL